MSREPPSKSLFSYPVAQTNQDLGRDKGKIRLCFGNCGKKEAMSQYLLSPEKIYCSLGRPWGKACTCIWRWSGKGRLAHGSLEGMELGVGGRECEWTKGGKTHWGNGTESGSLGWKELSKQKQNSCAELIVKGDLQIGWETHRCFFYCVRASNFNFFLIQYVWNKCGLEQWSLGNLGL